MERPGELSGYRAVAAAIVLAAAVLRFWALDMGLPHPMTRPDEEMILAHTGRAAAGETVTWAVYPPAYVYLTWMWGSAGLALESAAGFGPSADYVEVLREHPERIILVDRMLSALVGVVSVALLLAITRRSLGAAAAVVAGAILATSFLHVRDCHAVKPDSLLTLGGIAALGATIPLADRATLARGAVVGIIIGLTMAMKYPAVLLLAPVYIACVMGSPAQGWACLIPPAALAAAVAAGAVFVATSPSLLLDPGARHEVLSIVGVVFPGMFPSPVRPAFPEGLTGIPPAPAWWQGFVYHSTFSLWYGAGRLTTLLAPLAVVWGFRSRSAFARFVACYAVIYFVVNCLSPAMLSRYMTPMVPALAVLEGGLIAALAARAGGRRVQGLVLGLATVLLVAEPLAASVAHDRLAARVDTRVLAGEWIARNVPPGSHLAMIGTQVWAWGEPIVPRTLAVIRLKPDAAALAAEHVQYVVAHDHVLFSSHVDPAAMAVLAPRLRLLAEFDPSRPDRTKAVFEALDAFYIPMHGFGAVERPGPRIRIYRFE